MATKNFLFSRKSNFQLVVAAAFLILASCNTLRTRNDVENDRTKGTKGETSDSSGAVQPPRYDLPPTPPPPPNIEINSASSPIPAMPKIGLIFGPGGARAYGHIGFLQNMARMKVPIYGTVGIEWGAPVAALLSSKGQVYDVEWQMFKLKDEDLIKKSLIGSGGRVNEVTTLKDFFQNAFAGQKVEGFKYPFACPAYNIAKNHVYMMSRGSLDNLMPYCLPYPPVFKPFNRNVSAVRELKMAADFLRSQGANYIVLVNVLGKDGGRKSLVKESESADSVSWSEISSFYSKPQPGIDATIPIDLDNYLVTDFEKKRAIMQKGAEVSQKPLEAWARKLGF